MVRLDNGNALFTCYAGCDWRRVLEALDDKPSIERGVGLRPYGIDAEQPDRNAEYARHIWYESSRIDGTPAELYLRQRGIDGPWDPAALRFSAQAKHPNGLYYPAMVAAVTDAHLKITAIHRTFLTVDGRKAPVEPQKMMLGRCRGGAVRFGPAPVPSTVFIAEGIETALSVRQIFGDIRVYAGLSVYGMQAVELEPGIRKVVIVADGDEPGSVAFMAAQRAVAKYIKRGYDTYMLRCNKVGEDWNDILLSAIPPLRRRLTAFHEACREKKKCVSM